MKNRLQQEVDRMANGAEPKESPRAELVIRQTDEIPPRVTFPPEFMSGDFKGGERYVIVRSGPFAFDLMAENLVKRDVQSST